MDLLFKKYASPFLLLDGMITTGRFSEFVDRFIEIHNEDTTWEFYLHKVQDKSYAEFKDEISIPVVTQADIETTVTDSINILNSFNPKQ